MADIKPSTAITAEFRPPQSTDKLSTTVNNSMQHNMQITTNSSYSLWLHKISKRKYRVCQKIPVYFQALSHF